MSTMTLRGHATTKVASVIFFWSATAVAVTAADQIFDAVSPAGGLVAKIVIIVAMAFAYMRLAAHEPTIDEALLVGVAWATLAIVAEMITATSLSHDWFPLLGSPARNSFRNVLLLAWLVAPALFSRSRS